MKEILELITKEKVQQEKLLKEFSGGMEEYINTLEDSDTFYNEASSEGAVFALKAIEDKILGLMPESKESKEKTKELRDIGEERKEIIFIKDNRDSIHFVSDINNLDNDSDLWFKLEGEKSLFENVEKVLVSFKEAHNLTSIEQINDFDYKATYNAFNLDNNNELFKEHDAKATDDAIKSPLGLRMTLEEEVVLDAGMRQKIETKAKFIAQVKKEEPEATGTLFSEPSDEDRQSAMKELNKSKNLDYK